MRDFYRQTGAQEGDEIVLQRETERSFSIALVRNVRVRIAASYTQRGMGRGLRFRFCPRAYLSALFLSENTKQCPRVARELRARRFCEAAPGRVRAEGLSQLPAKRPRASQSFQVATGLGECAVWDAVRLAQRRLSKPFGSKVAIPRTTQ